jgi:hypothetical protein
VCVRSDRLSTSGEWNKPAKFDLPEQIIRANKYQSWMFIYSYIPLKDGAELRIIQQFDIFI